WRLRTATSYRQSVVLGWKRWERATHLEDEALGQDRLQEERRRMQSWDEHLDWLMDLMHKPGVRQWSQTNWSSREEEWRALRRIHGLDPDSNNTIIHPIQVDRKFLKKEAVYEYPGQPSEVNESGS